MQMMHDDFYSIATCCSRPIGPLPLDINEEHTYVSDMSARKPAWKCFSIFFRE